jgi:methyl-accepting chemotaxis protein
MSEIAGILSQQKEASNEIASSITGVASLAGESHEFVKRIAESMSKSTSQFLNNAREMFNADSDIALCYMAKIDHVMFKKRIVDTCMGTDNWQSHEVPDHHSCRLGKWYDGIRDETIRSLPSFKALIGPHEVVHSSAKKALNAAKAQDPEAMTEALLLLDKASADVLAALDDLAAAIMARHEEMTKAA